MNDHTRNRHTPSSVSTVTIGLCAVFLSTAISAAAVIADLRGDYDVSTRTNGIAANIADAQGSGRWTFFGRSAATVGASSSQLIYDTAADGSRTANAYVLPGQILDLPALSNAQLISGGAEGAPGANQLAVHPGETGTTFPFLVIRWTPGAAEYGSATISGGFQDIGARDNGTTISILSQSGSNLFSGTSNTGNLVSFNFATTLSSGSFIDFIIGNNGWFSGDQSAIGISIDGVPEPSAPLLSAATLALLAFRRRR